MTTSAPSSLTRPALAALAVVATCAPRCLASWKAMVPTPPEPAWIRTFWPGRTCRLLDERLPGSEGDQREGGGLRHAEGGRLEGQVVLVDGDEFGEGADAVLVGPGVDLVTHREPG